MSDETFPQIGQSGGGNGPAPLLGLLQGFMAGMQMMNAMHARKDAEDQQEKDNAFRQAQLDQQAKLAGDTLQNKQIIAELTAKHKDASDLNKAMAVAGNNRGKLAIALQTMGRTPNEAETILKNGFDPYMPQKGD